MNLKAKYFFFFSSLIICLSNFSNAQVINTVAGDGPAGTFTSWAGYFGGDGGPATAAGLNNMGNVAFDTAGNMFIADQVNGRIRKVNPAGIISTYAGGGTAFMDGGQATASNIFLPECIAIDKFGYVYVGDRGNYRIRKVDHSGIITTICGNGTGGYSGDGGLATAAKLQEILQIIFDTAGSMYFADAANNVVRKVSTSGTITTVAGNGFGAGGSPGSGAFTGDSGPATSAELNWPDGLAIDKRGNLYIADLYNDRVRKVDYSTGNITTFAGSATTGFGGDYGPATTAKLSGPGGLSFDDSGSLFISDAGNQRIRKVDTFGIITTVAGSGTMGSFGDGGPAIAAEFDGPDFASFDICGNMYVTDDHNNVIRKVVYDPPSINPIISVTGVSSASLGTTVTVNAAVSGAGGGSYTITWLKNRIAFSTTTVPVTSYIKGYGSDTITAIVTVRISEGCYSNGSSATHILAQAVGISIPGIDDIDIYPNPAYDILNINSLISTLRYVISNIVGVTLLQGELQNGNNSVDISSLKTGIYLLELNDPQGNKKIARLMKR